MGIDFFASRDSIRGRALGTLSDEDTKALLQSAGDLAKSWGLDPDGDWKLSGQQIGVLVDKWQETIKPPSPEALRLFLDLARHDVVYGYGD